MLILWLLNNSKKGHSLIIGVGEAGSKITLDIIKEVNSEYLLLNSKHNSKYTIKNIIIDTTSWINPPIYKIRESLMGKLDKILSIVNNYSNIIIIGNLASKFGIAIIPLLTNIVHLVLVGPYGTWLRDEQFMPLDLMRKRLGSRVLIRSQLF